MERAELAVELTDYDAEIERLKTELEQMERKKWEREAEFEEVVERDHAMSLKQAAVQKHCKDAFTRARSILLELEGKGKSIVFFHNQFNDLMSLIFHF